MSLDKVKLANKKFKRAQRRKQMTKYRSGELPITTFKRRLRTKRKHHMKKNGENRRNYRPIEDDEV